MRPKSCVMHCFEECDGMIQQPDVRTQAKQLYDAQNYEEAGRLYHQL